MDNYPILRHFRLPSNVNYFHKRQMPDFLHSDSPAMSAVVDFHEDNPPLVSPDATIEMALDMIKVLGLPVLLVTSDKDKLIGAITSNDILGNKPVEISRDQQVCRTQIKVEQVMTPNSNIQVMLHGTLKNAKVGHLVATLNEIQADYFLVSDGASEDELGQVTGMVSRSLLSRQLHQDLGSVLGTHRSLLSLNHYIKRDSA